MTERPLRGKGYAMVAVDRRGALCSLEVPCPVVQVRRPAPGASAVNCTNCYQLPALAEADRREPAAKENARARANFLEGACAPEAPFDLDRMKSILRHHGDPSICRHGPDDMSYTSFSFVALAGAAECLYMGGNPCMGEYARVGF